MNDKFKDSSKYEAAHKANAVLGDVRDENGVRILGTKGQGDEILTTFEKAESSEIDKLTGLLLRSEWEGRMDQHYKISKREGKSFIIAMLDLDEFKLYNDTEGHQRGDEILRKFGKSIRDRFRESDICGRYGGDEAIVMLTTSDLKENDIKSEQITVAKELTNQTGARVSVGMAKWDGISPLEVVIKAADDRLYHFKEFNRYEV